MIMEFWVSLIKVDTDKLGPFGLADLNDNCTHVTGPFWIMEGDTDALIADHRVIDEGAVPSLGDMSEDALIRLCFETFRNDWETA